VYNHQIFPTVDSFLEAFYNGTLKRRHESPEQAQDVSWSSRKRVGPQLDLDQLPGPRSVSFAGLRFRVDKELQYISWMGWGMYLGFNRDMGLSLWDVRIRGERIIYEVSPAFSRPMFPFPLTSPAISFPLKKLSHNTVLHVDLLK
jgi:primary-amine oxidase